MGLLRLLEGGRLDRRVDVLGALAILALGEAEVWLGGLPPGASGARGAHAFAALLVAVPLLWRRRAPLSTLAGVWAAYVVWELALLDLAEQPPLQPFVALLVATYTAAARSTASAAVVVVTAAGFATDVVAMARDRAVGDVLPAWVVLTLALGLGLAFGRGERARRALREEAETLERDRAEQAQRAVVAERTRIARELHDVIAHHISATVIQAGAERRVLQPGQESTGEALLGIEQSGRQALAELRRLLGVLRKSEAEDELAPQPGLDELDALADKVRAAGVQLELHVEGERVPLAPGLELAAYRVVQEALTNILTHAGEARAHVTVRYRRDALDLEILDDGGGTVGRNGHGSGHGLVGMRERASIYGGSVEAGERPEGGFVVRVCLPLETNS